MPFPTDNITENVFLDPTTETVSSGWSVFKKMKDAIKAIIASRGTPRGIASLDANTKVPIVQIPDDAVNPDLTPQFDLIRSNNNSNTAPSTPLIGQTWFETAENALRVFSSTGWKPIGGGGISLISNNVYRTSTTVTLKKGTYLLVPVGGEGSITLFYDSGFDGQKVVNGIDGQPSTIALDGFTAIGTPSKNRGKASTGIGLFGGSGGDIYADEPHKAGYTNPTQIKQITSQKTATITIGLGGRSISTPTAGNQDPVKTSPAGEPGWAAIWKLS